MSSEVLVQDQRIERRRARVGDRELVHNIEITCRSTLGRRWCASNGLLQGNICETNPVWIVRISVSVGIHVRGVGRIVRQIGDNHAGIVAGRCDLSLIDQITVVEHCADCVGVDLNDDLNGHRFILGDRIRVAPGVVKDLNIGVSVEIRIELQSICSRAGGDDRRRTSLQDDAHESIAVLRCQIFQQRNLSQRIVACAGDRELIGHIEIAIDSTTCRRDANLFFQKFSLRMSQNGCFDSAVDVVIFSAATSVAIAFSRAGHIAIWKRRPGRADRVIQAATNLSRIGRHGRRVSQRDRIAQCQFIQYQVDRATAGSVAVDPGADDGD